MIDLHTHSRVSDGTDLPERVAELAAQAGCSAIALTDHDRLDGVLDARRRAAELGVELIAGCELSCFNPYGRSSLHLLSYFVEPGDGPLQDELVHRLTARGDRNRRLVTHLHTLGLPIEWDELVAFAGQDDGIGRPHVAALLVRNGAAASIDEAFDRWLGDGRAGYVHHDTLDPAVAISLVRASGGVSALAHPLNLGLGSATLDSLIGELAATGLTGLECLYGRYSRHDREALSNLARRHSLVITGGSDYHGKHKPDLRVGVGRGDLHIRDGVLDELRERLPSS